MRPPPDAVSIELEVPFHDVDSQRIVWHGHYFKYLDLGRTALMRSRNVDVGDLLALDCRMVVTEGHCRYVFPLHYGDRFRVTAWFTDVVNRVRIAYLIWNLSHDRRTAKAYTTLVTTNAEGNLLWTTPDAIRSRLGG